MKVRQEWEGEPTELLCEGAMGKDTVDADAQNLGVGRFEEREIGFEGSQLNLSASGEVENVKG